MRRTILVAAFAALIGAIAAAGASQKNFLGVVFIADPTTPTQQAGVNGSGQLSVCCQSCGTC